jgi:hypothetical protein
MSDNPFVGSWSYTSFVSNPAQFLDQIGQALANPKQLLQNPQQCLDDLQELYDMIFGNGTLTITDGPMNVLTGTLGGPGWSLDLSGARSYGNPMSIRFQGKGTVGGALWIYDYVGYLAPQWPNGVQQRPALVGSIVRTIPHPTGADGQSTAPAGVVAQWIAVKQ